MGNTVQNFYVETFKDSYGDPQAVEVVAKKSLGDVKLRYRINDGAVKTANTSKFMGGERFGEEPGLFFHRLRGTVTGTNPGDEVEVWFEGGRKGSSHFTYTARSETGNKVLIMSAENYTAGVPNYPDTTGPSYLTYYTDALDANGVEYDIYDVDRRGNVSPDHLGVLSHYDAVLWYTGDDYLTRRPGQPAGTGTARLAVEEMIDVRHFLNEGGKLFYTGKSAGQQYAEGNLFRNFGFPEPPEGGAWCDNAQAGVRRGRPVARRRLHRPQRRLPAVPPRRLHLRGARQHVRRRERHPVRAARHGPVQRPLVDVRRDRRQQPGPFGDVRDHELGAGSGAATRRSRTPAAWPTGCARARRRSAPTAARSTSPPGPTARPTSGSARRSTSPVGPRRS